MPSRCRFDESRLPVHTIEVLDPEIAALSPDQYEIIDRKVSYRLAQRQGSYEILKYVRPVVKRRDTQQIRRALSPVGVIDGSRADVSFVAGLLVDKFARQGRPHGARHDEDRLLLARLRRAR